MGTREVLLPGQIFMLTDNYSDNSLPCVVVKRVELEEEQRKYENNLKTGFSSCNNFKCKYDYIIDSNGPKFCPHCGSELKIDLYTIPSVYDFFEHLKKLGFIKRYDDMKYHNTYYSA